MVSQHLLIVGASARAAAFSALRAGLHPHCVDLFADLDLQQRCSASRLTGRYPEGFGRFIDGEPPSAWMYTGGLENHPRLVKRWAKRRFLWGNGENALLRARDSIFIGGLLRSLKLPVPDVFPAGERPPTRGRWLLKPRRSAGGSGIRFWMPGQPVSLSGDSYLQEYIEGESLGLLFLGGERTAHLLGMTRQLVGENWLHAGPFRYCGSIGPVDGRMVRHPSLQKLGHWIASGCGLEGLFGVDGILREGTFWPVEINPRYTASVEVLEHATGSTFLTWHAHVFAQGRLPHLSQPDIPANRIIGKAILFARDDLYFPTAGPWMTELQSAQPVQELPTFADIPTAGARIEAGKPILTFFAAADSPAACEDVLRRIAVDLDRWLFER